MVTKVAKKMRHAKTRKQARRIRKIIESKNTKWSKGTVLQNK